MSKNPASMNDEELEIARKARHEALEEAAVICDEHAARWERRAANEPEVEKSFKGLANILYVQAHRIRKLKEEPCEETESPSS